MLPGLDALLLAEPAVRPDEDALLAELTAAAPDLMLTLMSRLVTGAFEQMDWVTRALISG